MFIATSRAIPFRLELTNLEGAEVVVPLLTVIKDAHNGG